MDSSRSQVIYVAKEKSTLSTPSGKKWGVGLLLLLLFWLVGLGGVFVCLVWFFCWGFLRVGGLH